MDIQKIKELALENGFKLKEQESGGMDLHSYVYGFAQVVYAEAQKVVMPKWISVEDQLPDFQQEVLIFSDNQIGISEYLPLSENDSGISFMEGFYTDGACSIDTNVTHWMLLPIAPIDE